MWVGGSGGTAAQKCQEQMAMTDFFLGFPFCFFPLLSWRAASQSSTFTPDLNFSPKNSPFILSEVQIFDCAVVAWEMSVRAVWRIFLWLFPSPICSKPFKGTKSPSALQPEHQHHPLQHHSFLVGLVKWKRERKIPNENWPKLAPPHKWWEEPGKITWEFSKIFNYVFYLPFPKSQCLLYVLSLCAKNSLREGPKAGIPEKYITLFLLEPPLSSQLSFHHWVHHPEHNQCLKHLKPGLSQLRKCTGFNVYSSTKALSSEHLTYWQAVWRGNIFLQVSSYFGSSEESISITIYDTDRAPCCFNSPRCCSHLSALYIKINTPINLNWVRK